MITIETIQDCLSRNTFIYSRHSLEEMAKEELGRIFESEIETVINLGEIIRQYPEDRPYPSVLIAGHTIENKPVHVVCAYNKTDKTTIVVTAYRPDPVLWLDLRTRRN